MPMDEVSTLLENRNLFYVALILAKTTPKCYYLQYSCKYS